MELIKVDNLKGLDPLVAGEFLQADFWRELLIKEGEIVETWGATEADKILAIATIIKKPLIANFFYYYAPRGPRGEKKAI
jgi:hypothetical protein